MWGSAWLSSTLMSWWSGRGSGTGQKKSAAAECIAPEFPCLRYPVGAGGDSIHEADAAGIVLVGRVVQTLRVRNTRPVHRSTFQTAGRIGREFINPKYSGRIFESTFETSLLQALRKLLRSSNLAVPRSHEAH